jgi:hypothetical protein
MSRRRNLIRMLAATAVAAVALGTAGGALAATAPPASPSPAPGLVFVPPSVGPICVNIGAIIINGKVINPALHVCLPGFTAPPIIWRPF